VRLQEGTPLKALTWQGKRSVSVKEVPDPVIQEPTDAIVRITSSAICGSDLHLYEVLGPYMHKDDVLGHEPMGIVEEVGSAVTNLAKGDRVVIPFNISCGHCYMCSQGLQSQCETSQVREKNSGAALYGYSELYGSIPGGQAEYLRVPFADYGPVKVGQELPDERYLFLSDILPTAWQAVKYADSPAGGTLAVFGLGPVGQFATRVGAYFGQRVIGVDPVPERREMAARHGVEVLDYAKDIADELREMTGGRGPDAVVDAVGMEAHGSPVAGFAPPGTRPPSGQGGAEGHGNRRRGPASCCSRGDRLGPARGHPVPERRLRGHGQPHAAAHNVRQADPAAHGPVQRPPVDR
jgi:threonine dehydrogenase-like Zn-dependent dehydrogenase